MQYFTHTLKACGSLALALALTGCGEELVETASEGAGQSASQTLTELTTNSLVDEQTDEQATSTTTTEIQPINVANGAGNSTPTISVGASLNKDTIAESVAVANTPTTSTDLNNNPAASFADNQTPASTENNLEPAPKSTENRLPADPTVTLVANTTSGANGSGTNLRWSAENVDSCEASGAWEGQVGVSGVRDLNNDTAGDHTFRISCRSTSGTAVAMVTVSVESATLAWQPPAQNTNGSEITDLAGYNLYFGTTSGNYTQVRPVRDPSQTALELPVESGTYYVAMTAYDLSGNESELSNEVIRVVN